MKSVLCALAVGLLTMGSVAKAGEQDFTLVNDTGVEISQIFISSAAVDNWEENLLAKDEVLPSGNEVEIKFSPEENAELWDIKVMDSDGSSVTWERLKLTEITKVTLKITDGKPIAELENGDASGE